MTDRRSLRAYLPAPVRRTARRIVDRVSQTIATAPRYPDRLTIRVDDLSMQFVTDTESVRPLFYPRYAEGRLHEEPIVRWFKRHLRADDRFLDVGSNVGFYTLLAGKICVDGVVYAVDMDCEMIHQLRRTLALNATGPVELFCAGLTDRCDEIVRFGEADSGDSSTNAIFEWDDISSKVESDDISSEAIASTANAQSCLATTTDRYAEMLGTQFDAIKIDVEGHERRVLRGMRHTLQNTRLVALELHDEVRRDEASLDEIVELLRLVNPTMWAVQSHRHQPDWTRLENRRDWDAVQSNAMILCHRDSAERL